MQKIEGENTFEISYMISLKNTTHGRIIMNTPNGFTQQVCHKKNCQLREVILKPPDNLFSAGGLPRKNNNRKLYKLKSLIHMTIYMSLKNLKRWIANHMFAALYLACLKLKVLKSIKKRSAQGNLIKDLSKHKIIELIFNSISFLKSS